MKVTRQLNYATTSQLSLIQLLAMKKSHIILATTIFSLELERKEKTSKNPGKFPGHFQTVVIFSGTNFLSFLNLGNFVSQGISVEAI